MRLSHSSHTYYETAIYRKVPIYNCPFHIHIHPNIETGPRTCKLKTAQLHNGITELGHTVGYEYLAKPVTAQHSNDDNSFPLLMGK
jgi:hypothetical protein